MLTATGRTSTLGANLVQFARDDLCAGVQTLALLATESARHDFAHVVKVAADKVFKVMHWMRGLVRVHAPARL